MEGITGSGFIFEIEKERLENYELLEYMAEVDDNPLLLPKVIKLLLGENQASALKTHIRDEKGMVSADRISEELNDIFSEIEELKN